MTNPTSKNAADPAERLPRPGIWDLLVAEDDTQLDPELIAAYVEGRLDPHRHEEIRQLVARSPKAMDMADALYEFLESQAEASPAAAEIRPAEAAAISRAEHSRSPTLLLALAASLLVAAMTGYLAVERARTAADLRNEVALLDQKVRLAPLTPALLAESDPATALSALGPRARSVEEPLDSEERKTRLEGLRAVSDSFTRRIATQGETAELLNLRAAAALGIAELVPAGDSQAETDRRDPDKGMYWRNQAEKDLRRAVELDGRFVPAWFNLALLLERSEREPEAQQAWQQYLESETREHLRQAVREHLGTP